MSEECERLPSPIKCASSEDSVIPSIDVRRAGNKTTLKKSASHENNESTEYRRAFGFEKKSSSQPQFIPQFPPTRHQEGSGNMRTILNSSTLSSDTWTTSYMRDFKKPTKGSKVNSKTTQHVVGVSGDKTTSIDVTPTPTTPSKVNETPEIGNMEYGHGPTGTTRRGRSCAAERNQHVNTITRYSNYLPNPVPEDKPCIDDDMSANPSLKGFIDLIARK